MKNVDENNKNSIQIVQKQNFINTLVPNSDCNTINANAQNVELICQPPTKKAKSSKKVFIKKKKQLFK